VLIRALTAATQRGISSDPDVTEAVSEHIVWPSAVRLAEAAASPPDPAAAPAVASDPVVQQ
jgi:hypothetical protein